MLLGKTANEDIGQQRRIAQALTQRRDGCNNFRETIVEILAESSCLDQLLEILMRRANNAQINSNLLSAANALQDTLLQKAKQFGL